MDYKNTIVKDGFDFNAMECQYFDICKYYSPGNCDYVSPCALRQELRDTLENSVAAENERFQVDLIKQ